MSTYDGEWTYDIERGMPPLRYRVTVRCAGHRIERTYTGTKWGARYAARRIKRQAIALHRARQRKGGVRESGTL